MFTILACINTVNVENQITFKKEDNNFIVFLDANKTKTTDCTLHFSVYRMPTSNKRYLDYNSNNPTYGRNNSTIAKFWRTYAVCSEGASKT